MKELALLLLRAVPAPRKPRTSALLPFHTPLRDSTGIMTTAASESQPHFSPHIYTSVWISNTP